MLESNISSYLENMSRFVNFASENPKKNVVTTEKMSKMPSTHLRSKANLNLLLSFPLSLPWCHDDLARLLQYEILINIKLKVFTYHQTWKPLSWSHLDASFGLFGRWVGHVTRHDNTWQIAPWKSCFPGHMTIWLEIKMVANVVYTAKCVGSLWWW